ncbi:hypothetical protein RSPO_c00094 [Ralstonia solanacearum Po82]|uniref:Uncharacterized protein n=1 Tax=Ralstonia solanacearum (strain Po82) TaxID=1031711 RepID=F6G5Y2_RALS8|nr:hypothetical protein RSPO_c00094 [Ralstonia solanacearum Po82]
MEDGISLDLPMLGRSSRLHLTLAFPMVGRFILPPCILLPSFPGAEHDDVFR